MQLTTRRTRRLLAVAFSLTLLGGAACGDDDNDNQAQEQSGGDATSSEPIVIAGLEGEVAEGGPDFTKGMQIAADQINAAGGVEGRKIEVRISKTGGTPEGAASAYRAAGSDTAVLASFLGASGALAIRDLSTTVKLPIVTASGNDKVDRPVTPYVFNNAPTSELVTSSLRYAVENFGAKKVAAIHYETDFSSQIPDALKTGCQRLGCTVVAVEKGSATSAVDALVPQLTKMRNANPDVYYIETLNPAAIAAARQLKLDKPIIAEQWLTVPPLAQACGAACEGVVFGGHKCRAPELLEGTDPLKKHCDEYIAAFKQKFPSEPFALFSIYGHDAVRTYAEAAGRVLKGGGKLDRESLVKSMETFNGSGFLTSHGYIKTAADNHRLTGSWKEAYLNLTVEADGQNVKWVLAPKAQASGAEA
ncbi:MAG TPA: ABC transporter substrate-binding protein [Acidimicrobiia bacterium]|nr:ABC transporter substrate-binding protein [Acidimicrobiia bacterium]